MMMMMIKQYCHVVKLC